MPQDVLVRPKKEEQKRPVWQEMQDIAERLGATVTSTTGGKHNVGSLHGKERAIDVRVRDLGDQAKKILIGAYRDAGYLAVDESKKPKGQKVWGGPHIHVEKDYEGISPDDWVSGVRPEGAPSPEEAGKRQTDAVFSKMVAPDPVQKARDAIKAGMAASLKKQKGPLLEPEEQTAPTGQGAPETLLGSPLRSGGQVFPQKQKPPGWNPNANFNFSQQPAQAPGARERDLTLQRLQGESAQETDTAMYNDALQQALRETGPGGQALRRLTGIKQVDAPIHKRAAEILSEMRKPVVDEETGKSYYNQEAINRQKLLPKMVAAFPDVAAADKASREKAREEATQRRMSPEFNSGFGRQITRKEAEAPAYGRIGAISAVQEALRPLGAALKMVLTRNPLGAANPLTAAFQQLKPEQQRSIVKYLYPRGEFLGADPKDLLAFAPEAATNPEVQKNVERARTIGGLAGGTVASMAEALPTGAAGGMVAKALGLSKRVGQVTGATVGGGLQGAIDPEVYKTGDGFFDITGGRGKYLRDRQGNVISDEAGNPVVVDEQGFDVAKRFAREGIASGLEARMGMRPAAPGSLAAGRLVDRSFLGQAGAAFGSEFATGAVVDPLVDPSLAGRDKPLDQNLLDSFAEILPELVRAKGIRIGYDQLGSMIQNLRRGVVTPEAAQIMQDTAAAPTGVPANGNGGLAGTQQQGPSPVPAAGRERQVQGSSAVSASPTINPQDESETGRLLRERQAIEQQKNQAAQGDAALATAMQQLAELAKDDETVRRQPEVKAAEKEAERSSLEAGHRADVQRYTAEVEQHQKALSVDEMGVALYKKMLAIDSLISTIRKKPEWKQSGEAAMSLKLEVERLKAEKAAAKKTLQPIAGRINSYLKTRTPGAPSEPPPSASGGQQDLLSAIVPGSADIPVVREAPAFSRPTKTAAASTRTGAERKSLAQWVKEQGGWNPGAERVGEVEDLTKAGSGTIPGFFNFRSGRTLEDLHADAIADGYPVSEDMGEFEQQLLAGAKNVLPLQTGHMGMEDMGMSSIEAQDYAWQDPNNNEADAIDYRQRIARYHGNPGDATWADVASYAQEALQKKGFTSSEIATHLNRAREREDSMMPPAEEEAPKGSFAGIAATTQQEQADLLAALRSSDAEKGRAALAAMYRKASESGASASHVSAIFSQIADLVFMEDRAGGAEEYRSREQWLSETAGDEVRDLVTAALNKADVSAAYQRIIYGDFSNDAINKFTEAATAAGLAQEDIAGIVQGARDDFASNRKGQSTSTQSVDDSAPSKRFAAETQRLTAVFGGQYEYAGDETGGLLDVAVEPHRSLDGRVVVKVSREGQKIEAVAMLESHLPAFFEELGLEKIRRTEAPQAARLSEFAGIPLYSVEELERKTMEDLSQHHGEIWKNWIVLHEAVQQEGRHAVDRTSLREYDVVRGYLDVLDTVARHKFGVERIRDYAKFKNPGSTKIPKGVAVEGFKKWSTETEHGRTWASQFARLASGEITQEQFNKWAEEDRRRVIADILERDRNRPIGEAAAAAPDTAKEETEAWRRILEIDKASEAAVIEAMAETPTEQTPETLRLSLKEWAIAQVFQGLDSLQALTHRAVEKFGLAVRQVLNELWEEVKDFFVGDEGTFGADFGLTEIVKQIKGFLEDRKIADKMEDVDEYGYFVETARAVKKVMKGPMPKEQLIKALLGSGVKQRELNWLSLEAIPQTRDPKSGKLWHLTRDEVLEYIAAHKPELKIRHFGTGAASEGDVRWGGYRLTDSSDQASNEAYGELVFTWDADALHKGDGGYERVGMDQGLLGIIEEEAGTIYDRLSERQSAIESEARLEVRRSQIASEGLKKYAHAVFAGTTEEAAAAVMALSDDDVQPYADGLRGAVALTLKHLQDNMRAIRRYAALTATVKRLKLTGQMAARAGGLPEKTAEAIAEFAAIVEADTLRTAIWRFLAPSLAVINDAATANSRVIDIDERGTPLTEKRVIQLFETFAPPRTVENRAVVREQIYSLGLGLRLRQATYSPGAKQPGVVEAVTRLRNAVLGESRRAEKAEALAEVYRVNLIEVERQLGRPFPMFEVEEAQAYVDNAPFREARAEKAGKIVEELFTDAYLSYRRNPHVPIETWGTISALLYAVSRHDVTASMRKLPERLGALIDNVWPNRSEEERKSAKAAIESYIEWIDVGAEGAEERALLPVINRFHAPPEALAVVGEGALHDLETAKGIVYPNASAALNRYIDAEPVIAAPQAIIDGALRAYNKIERRRPAKERHWTWSSMENLQASSRDRVETQRTLLAEALAADRQAASRLNAKDEKVDTPLFTTGHWRGVANPVVHLRYQPKRHGDKLFFHIVEMQSDWAKAARQMGVKETPGMPGYEASRMRRGMAAQRVAGPGGESVRVAVAELGRAVRAAADEDILGQVESLLQTRDVSALDTLAEAAGSAEYGAVPVNPWVEGSAWRELALKQALKIAAEAGMDGISWDEGKIQSDRFSMSAAVTKIEKVRAGQEAPFTAGAILQMHLRELETELEFMRSKAQVPEGDLSTVGKRWQSVRDAVAKLRRQKDAETAFGKTAVVVNLYTGTGSKQAPLTKTRGDLNLGAEQVPSFQHLGGGAYSVGPEDAVEIFGSQEMARQIFRAADGQAFTDKELRPLAGWATHLYDKAVPSTLRQLGKAFGAKIQYGHGGWRLGGILYQDRERVMYKAVNLGRVSMGEAQDEAAAGPERFDEAARQWGFEPVTLPFMEIPDDLREAVVTRGQSLFDLQGAAYKAAEYFISGAWKAAENLRERYLEKVQGLFETKTAEIAERMRDALAKKDNVAITDNLAEWIVVKVFHGTGSLQRLTREAVEVFGREVRRFMEAAWEQAKQFFYDELGSADADLGLARLSEKILKGLRDLDPMVDKAVRAFFQKAADNLGGLPAKKSLVTPDRRETNKVKETARNSVPGLFKAVDWVKGQRNADYGGGPYDVGSEFLKGQGVRNIVVDPFARDYKYNEAKASALLAAGADTGTLAGVLHVISKPEVRQAALRKAGKLVKRGGRIFISVSEGDGSGIGVAAKNGTWHNNMPLADYLDEIQQVYPDARIVSNRGQRFIEATNRGQQKALNADTAIVIDDKELLRGVEEMSSWKDWYDRHNEIIDKVFGEDADLFKKILAATSQHASVKGNITFALRAYGQMVNGLPFEGVMRDVAENLKRIREGEDVKGLKVSEFAKALAGDREAVTVDLWVARLLFNTDQPTPAQNAVAKAHIKYLAEKKGWTPREMQAAVWALAQVRAGREVVQDYGAALTEQRDAIVAIRAAFLGAKGGSLLPGARASRRTEGVGDGAVGEASGDIFARRGAIDPKAYQTWSHDRAGFPKWTPPEHKWPGAMENEWVVRYAQFAIRPIAEEQSVVIYMNRIAGAMLNAMFNMGPLSGLHVNEENFATLLRVVTSKSSRMMGSVTAETAEAMAEYIHVLASAKMLAEDRGLSSFIFIDTEQRRPVAEIMKTILHETVHASQTRAGKGDIDLVSDEWFRSVPEAAPVHSSPLRLQTGTKGQVLATEAVAYILSGDREVVGFDKTENGRKAAARFLVQYFKEAIDNHGVEVLKEFDRYHPDFQELFYAGPGDVGINAESLGRLPGSLQTEQSAERAIAGNEERGRGVPEGMEPRGQRESAAGNGAASRNIGGGRIPGGGEGGDVGGAGNYFEGQRETLTANLQAAPETPPNTPEEIEKMVRMFLPANIQLVPEAKKRVKEAAKRLVDAYYNESLPYQRTIKIATLLKAEKWKDRQKKKQADWIVQTTQKLQEFTTLTAALDASHTGDPAWKDLMRAQRRATLILQNELSKAGDYTRAYQYPAKIGRASLLLALHILQFNVLNQAADVVLHEGSKLMPGPHKWLNEITGGEIPRGIKVNPEALAIGVRAVLDQVFKAAKDAKSGFGTSESYFTQTAKYGESELLLNQDVAMEIYKREHRLSGKKLPKGLTGGAERFEGGHREKGLGPVSTAINAVHRAHGVADVAGRTWAYSVALAGASQIMAEKKADDIEKLARELGKPFERKKWVAEFARQIAMNPDPVTQLIASMESNHFVMDVETQLHSAFQGLKNTISGIHKVETRLEGQEYSEDQKKKIREQFKTTKRYKIGDVFNSLVFDFLTVPFAKIPIAAGVAKFYRYTPFSAVFSTARMAQMVSDKRKGAYVDPLEAYDTFRNIQKGAMGTVAWLVMSALGALGWYELIEGDDSAPRIRRALQALGYDFEPEVYVPGWDAALRLKGAGTIGGQLALAARVKGAMVPRVSGETGKMEPFQDVAMRVLGAGGRAVIQDLPVTRAAYDQMTGLRDMSEGRSTGSNLMRNVASRVVPGIVREYAKNSDEYRRVVDSRGPITQQMKEAIQTSIPGWREELPVAQTGLGEKVRQRGEFELARELRPNQKVKAFLSKGVGLPVIKREREESVRDYNERVRVLGDETVKLLNRIDPAMLDSYPQEVQIRVFNKLLTKDGIERANRLTDKSLQREIEIEARKAVTWQTIEEDPRFKSLSGDRKQEVRSKFSQVFGDYKAEVGKDGRVRQPARAITTEAERAAERAARRSIEQ